MKNIKKFNNFINEELDKETYLSAANKAGERGQGFRRDKFRDKYNDIKSGEWELEKSELKKEFMSKFSNLLGGEIDNSDTRVKKVVIHL